jgi:hypothetical protein
MIRYVYTGSTTAQALAQQGFDVELRKGQMCDPVRHDDGRVIRSTDAGVANALVRFEDGAVETVSPRRLRLISKLPRVYLVASSKSKRSHYTQMQYLYTGDLFQKSRRYVLQEIRDRRDTWRIISAKYGKIAPGWFGHPYDLSINDLSADERRAWAQDLADELCGRRRTHFVFLAGKRYREHLIPRLQAEGHPCSVPMRGLGIGEQKAWLKKRINQDD